jgi:hypothetical protein
MIRLCSSRRAFAAALFLTVATLLSPLEPSMAEAQTPLPNFSVTRDPTFFYGAWPADFNRDGRTDLIAGTWAGGPGAFNPANLVVAIGRGDGTFRTPRALNIVARPVGTGHFNGDRFVDVVLVTEKSLAILPGNGNGTFCALRRVGDAPDYPFAHVADFDGNGTRDIVTRGRDSANEPVTLIYPGNGDFTFGTPQVLNVRDPVSAVSGDFDRDGRRDLAMPADCCSVYVFLNRGGLLFDMHEIPMARDLADVTTADMNGDGALDLLVAQFFVGGSSIMQRGTIAVLLGNGNGTFKPKVEYDTGVRGEVSIVAGDFNGDGRLDVATGNWSPWKDDDLGEQVWDSISIVPGDGAGHLLKATTFALGTINRGDLEYVFTHNSLNTSDLNGDGRTDLIGSPGAILLNRPPAPNRRPTVWAGFNETVYEASTPGHTLTGYASDPDMHWLYYRWTRSDGLELRQRAPFAADLVGRGTFTYTLRVNDLHGGVATDTVTIKFADYNDPFVQIPPPAAEIRAGVPVTLHWTASSDRGLTRFDIWRSSDDGRNWVRIPECTNRGAAARSCVWSSPGPVSGSSRVRVKGFGASGSEWIDVSDRFRIED